MSAQAQIAMGGRIWSPEQILFNEWFEGGTSDENMVGTARAGTGKTTTGVEGVNRAPEKHKLMAAFNKEIATELESRLGGVADAKTLHSLGFGYVRRNWKVKVDASDRPWDLARAAAKAVVPGTDCPKQVLTLIKNLHTKARDVDPFIALGDSIDPLVAMAVRFDLMPDSEFEVRGWDVKMLAKVAHKAMMLAMEKTSVIDFADMIFLPLVHDWVVPNYDLVVIDEAQDMTLAQLCIAMGSNGGRMAVIGDDRQAIYGFRGADSNSLSRLKVELKARELGLKMTRRCGHAIVKLAKEIVPDFVAHESNPDGEVRYMTSEKMIKDVRPGDFILSRLNAPLVTACMALLKNGVRAKIRGRDIGAGIMTLIDKMKASSVDDLERKLKQWAEAEIRRAYKKLSEDQADERVATVNDQKAIILALSDRADTISEVTERCMRLFQDKVEELAVTCSSIHRAKGLEAEIVYVLADTLRGGDIEEDNIRYVAITRAKSRLVFVSGTDMEID